MSQGRCGVRGWLLTDRRIGNRTNLGHLRGGQDDQHREDKRGPDRKDRLDRKVADSVQSYAEQYLEYLRCGLGCGTDDLHILTPRRVVVSVRVR